MYIKKRCYFEVALARIYVNHCAIALVFFSFGKIWKNKFVGELLLCFKFNRENQTRSVQ